MLDAVCISDLHLGSDNCRAKELVEFIKSIEAKILILNGDVFDSIDFRRLKKHHWHVLSALRKISDTMDVRWISGNHDGPAEIISHLLGIQVVNELVLVSGDRKILFLHGDRYDKYVSEHLFITWVGDVLYGFLQKIDKSHYWARLAKHNSKHFARCQEMVEKGALSYARELGCDIVCCGHTHQAVTKPGYFNSGCWTEVQCHYLTVHGGEVRLLEYADNLTAVS
jgi:UDP-2,3-diacylglucosamine pyrophosphatase LpxH